MSAVFWLIDTIINIYIWLLIAQAILSWLLAFGVVNREELGRQQRRHGLARRV